MSKLKFDLAEEGLHCVLKPYQAEIMRFLWETQTPQDSRAVTEYIKSVDIEGAKSRAAVIFFLNYMVDEGFLNYMERPTKGGYKRVYSLNGKSKTEQAFRETVYNIFAEKLLVFMKGGG